MHHPCIRALLLAGSLAMAGCSEKPFPPVLVWEPVPLNFKSGFRSVVALSPDEAIAVGYGIPEFLLLAQPVCRHRASGVWVDVPVPGHRDESFRLLDLTCAADGTLWACGALQSAPDDPFTARPVVYRFDAGIWSEVSLAELGDASGVVLTAIVASGSGSRFELRAVGRRADQTGEVIQYRDGRWTWMPIPQPGPGSPTWGLATVGRSFGGVWYAAGERGDAPGGAVFADRGAGWEVLTGPPIDALQFTDLAFDAGDTPYFTANSSSGDLPEGILFALRGGVFVAVPVARQSTGAAQYFTVGFDAQGHGWIGGGHQPDDMFLAGNLTGTWVESLTEHEPAGAPVGESEQGGEILCVGVAAKDRAFAVGQAEESGVEGNLEIIPRILELVPRPAGEIDKPTLGP